MEKIKEHLNLLGYKVEDKVTKIIGVVDSVSFDLYGCVQAAINPGLDEKGEHRNSRWYDVSRLKIIDKKAVMEAPNFDFGNVAEGKQGPANKTSMHRN